MKQLRPSVVGGAAALAIFLCAASSATVAAQTHGSGIEKISSYAGTWTSRIVHYATKYSKARVETATVRNDCWRSADYYSCHQFVDGRSSALIVYTYDAKHRLYHTHAIPQDGNPAPSGLLTITGNTWMFPWQDRDGGKTVYVRIVNVFRNPRTIDFRQEFSLDNTHWTKTADGVEHRTATP